MVFVHVSANSGRETVASAVQGFARVSIVFPMHNLRLVLTVFCLIAVLWSLR